MNIEASLGIDLTITKNLGEVNQVIGALKMVKELLEMKVFIVV